MLSVLTDFGSSPMPVDKSESRVRRMFGEIAPRYDLLNRMLSGGTDVYWRWRTVRLLNPGPEGPILDVCTGTGDLALAFWKRANGRVAGGGNRFHARDARSRPATKPSRRAGDMSPPMGRATSNSGNRETHASRSLSRFWKRIRSNFPSTMMRFRLSAWPSACETSPTRAAVCTR